MKKTAIILFPQFCNYEIAILLEILALNEKPVDFMAATMSPIRCEEGMQVVPDMVFDMCEVEAYDSMVISGSYAEGLYWNFRDEALLLLIRQFHEHQKLIAAISSGPMLLCKAGVTQGSQFLAGVEREWFLSDKNMLLSLQQMEGLVDVNDMKQNLKSGSAAPTHMLSNGLLTAYGWHFREWAQAFASALGLEGYPDSFGLPSS